MKSCPFEPNVRCELWIDYQVACTALQEAEELCSSNWKEIDYLLNKVYLLESLLSEAGIKIPE